MSVEAAEKCKGCEATQEELDLLASGEYNCYELWGGPYPTCYDCCDMERNNDQR